MSESEFERLRNSDTGIPLQTKAEVEDYAVVVLKENQVLRRWRDLALEALPEMPGLRDDPARARAWLLGPPAVLRERLRKLERERAALFDLLADVVPDSMPEDWQQRNRAFRGGYLVRDTACPACGSPAPQFLGMVYPRDAAVDRAHLCEHAYHTRGEECFA